MHSLASEGKHKPIPLSSHNLIIEVRNIHNSEDIKNVSVRKVKRAFLKPKQVGLVPLEVQTNKEAIINENKNDSKLIEQPKGKSATLTKPLVVKPRIVENPKSRTAQSQKKRAGKDTPIINNIEEWEVEEFLKEGIDKKTSEKIYFVKWKGYSEKDCTWEGESDLEHAPKLLQAWQNKKKEIEDAGKSKKRIAKKKTVV